MAPQGSWPATVKAGGFQSTAATATNRAAPEGPILAAGRGLWGAGEWEPSGGWWEKRIETWGSGKRTLNAVRTLLDEKEHPKIMIFWPLKDKVLIIVGRLNDVTVALHLETKQITAGGYCATR